MPARPAWRAVGQAGQPQRAARTLSCPSPAPPGRARPGATAPPAALPSFLASLLPTSSSAEAKAKADLIALVTDPALAKGAKGGPKARARVEAAIDACIAAAGKGATPPTASDRAINGGKRQGKRERERERGEADGTKNLSIVLPFFSLPLQHTVWELVWTTEKETLAIADTIGPLFRGGAPTGGIFQVIDVPAGSLQNVITFPPGDGAFVVDSSCYPDDEAGASPNPARLNFKFGAARLDAWGKEGWLRLPPVGQGWFDTVWLDPGGEWRAARDVRGDTLVVRRVRGGRERW